jgi:MoxR-like ATPase
MRRVVDALNQVLVEREDAVRALALAVLSQEHVVFLGAPGTAKTFMVRALAKALGGLDYFATLLNPTTPPEAVVGPVNLGYYEKNEPNLYKTDGMAPGAQLVFLDEIFKGNWAIQNLILTMMQDRIFYNGSLQQQCPLISLIGASNEMPREEGLEAVWDRFLVRVQISYIRDRAGLRGLILNPPSLDQVPQVMTPEDLRDQQEAAAGVALPEPVVDRAIILRDELQQHGIEVSDRRWVKALHGEPPHAGLVQASAFLGGRDEAAIDDLEVLVWTCWQDPGQIAEVQTLVYGVSNPVRQAVVEAKDLAYDAYTRALQKVQELDEQAAQARRDEADATPFTSQAANVLIEAVGTVREAGLQLQDLGEGLTGRSAELVEQTREQIKGWQSELLIKMNA